MANSYTAIPNIVPGNLKVNGNLTVSGGQIALGQYQRKFRIQEISNGIFYLTVNCDRLTHIQDDPSSPSTTCGQDSTIAWHNFLYQAAGVPAVDIPQLQVGNVGVYVPLAELRVGAATPYTRLYNVPGNSGGFTVNLQKDLATRDDAASGGYGLYFISPLIRPQTTVVNPAGISYGLAYRMLYWLDRTLHTATGTTGFIILASNIVCAKSMGITGAIYLRWEGDYTISTPSAGNLALNWGGTIVTVCFPPAGTSGSFTCEATIVNAGTANSQKIITLGHFGTNTTTVATNTAAVDSTVGQNIFLLSGNTQTADVVNCRNIEAYLVNTQ